MISWLPVAKIVQAAIISAMERVKRIRRRKKRCGRRTGLHQKQLG
ncbi:hypothetical protein [Anaerotignum sp. MB30-C6]|nr:hypothetical protein [Anaerotignum sp. MB30-C6]WMI80919.1 hypothetical protein RBQ60_14030 [Anaerotignum sp. MB30-C6]